MFQLERLVGAGLAMLIHRRTTWRELSGLRDAYAVELPLAVFHVERQREG